MNANCFKTVFSERLGCLVAVGEHACSQGKSSGESAFGRSAFGASVLASASVFIGALVLSQVFVGLAWAQPAANALPTGGTVVQGAASLVQSANQLNITQSTQRAAINWQSFDIGASAKVNVVQPNAQAVLLNRVVGQSPSQIFGQLQANGHVILVNPNGVLFGKDGSVNSGSFTASTLGITDANFMAGNMVYERNGSTAGVVNQGTIEVSPGGYVALLGASVSNEGKIIAPKGGVALGAAETIKVPVTGSGRIKLELTAGDINASVKNSGAIVSEGGQVYMQALALNRAAAQILQSGRIDTTGEQGGAVHLLADGGTIKVDGSITANSTGTDDKGQALAGGDIYMGRDKDTNVLAAVGDVSGATLESRGGFVETSGQYLATTGTRVLAKDWLLDPYNITIAASGASGTAYSSAYTPGADSVILASDIAANLNAGTNVTIETGLSGSAGASDGNIVVNAAIVKSGSSNATLTLTANNGITVNQRIGRAAADTTSTGKLDVVLTANGDATNALNSQGITLNSVVDANGGQVTLTGTSKNTSGVQTGPTYTYGVTNNSRSGVVFNGGSGITADNYQVTGTHTVAAGNSFGVNGVYMNGAVTFKATGNTDSNITGNSNAQGNFGAGVMVMDGATIRLENQGTGVTTLKGSNTNTGGGNGVRIGASTNTAVINAIGRVTLGQQTANVNAPIFIRGILNASQNSVNLSGLRIVGQTGLNTSAVQIWDTNINATGIDVVVDGVTANATGVLLQTSPNTTWNTKNLTVTGVANTTSGSSGSGVVVQRFPNVLTVNASGNMAIEGTVQGAGTGRGLHFAESGWGAQAPRLIANGNITLRGNNRASASNGLEAVYIAAGVQAIAGGNITLQGETNNAAINAINLYSAATGYTNWNTAGASALQGNTTLQATGNVLIQANQGGILLNNQLSSTLNNGGTPLLTSDTKITGLNITFDNTGAGMTTGASNTLGSGNIDANGFVTQGSGKSTASTAGIRLTDGRAISAKNTLNIFGASTVGSGVLISGAAALSAGASGFTGNMFIRGENTSAAGAAINISNASSTLSATNILNLTSSGTGSGTSLVAAGGIQVGAELQVENPAAGTISGVISGSGLLRKIGTTGTGTLALTATNTYTGGTVANGGILQVGNGGTTGTLGVGGTVSVGAVLSFRRSDVVEVSQAISGAGQLWQTGTGSTVLTGNNTYTGTTVVSAGTLQMGNGGTTGTLGTGAVTLSNSANLSFVRSADTVIGNAISGAGNVSASITGTDSDLTVNGAMALTGGTVNLAADGHLTVTQNIGTTNSGSAAVVLNAGKALSAGDASGGNIVFSGSGAVSVSGSGRATLFTGSVAGSTGLGVIGGNNRFNSDEVSSGYTTALGSGTYAVYREAPTLGVAFDNALKTYDGLAFAGGATQVQGWVGNDSVAQLGSLSYSGTAQGAVNAGVYSISGTAPSASALGYNVSYTPGTLTVNRATLTASLTESISKEYDGTHAASGLTDANFVITGWASPNGVTEGATVAQTRATYSSKNVPDNTGAGTVTASLSASDFTPTGTTLLSNYVLPTIASGNVGTITPAPLEVKVGSTAMFVTQNPNTAFDTGMSYVGLKNGETSSAVLGALTRAYNGVANPGIGNYTGVYGLSAVPTAANYTVTVIPGNLEVLAADKLLIQVGSRSQTYGAVTASNAGVTTAAQGVSALYCVGGVTCNTISALSLTDLGGGNWRATDTLGSSIRFSTRVDVSGAMSPAGYLSVGNYDYSVGSWTVEGGQNFTSMALAGGALTITPKVLSLTPPNVTKVYDGSDRLVGMGLSPSGVLAGDAVTALASGGTFAGQNAGAHTYTLSGLQLQGADKSNYSLSPEPVSGTGSITPKTLSLSAWALSKTYDGTTAATVNWDSLNGLVGSEQLGVSAQGTFASADVGNDKAVFATFSLANGANGGLASNYVLAPQTLTASILKKDEAVPVVPDGPGRQTEQKRPVQPESWPQTSRLKPTAVVYEPTPILFAQPAQGQSLNGLCADDSADSCACRESPVSGIQICYVPRGVLEKESTQTAKSDQAADR